MDGAHDVPIDARIAVRFSAPLPLLSANAATLRGTSGFAVPVTYDNNGNRTSIVDARTSPNAFTYDSMDRMTSRTDPLVRSETFLYDANGNVRETTDRKGQTTTHVYDVLNRLSHTTYADGSTTTYTYDAGDRLIRIDDSLSGTIIRTYDGLDSLTSEETPEGSVNYTYDAAGRRSTMTVFGQPSVSYTYDDANRLTEIHQGTSSVGIAYDTANRRTSVTLPNGIIVRYQYDEASQLLGLAYWYGEALLGDLTYTYDAAGNRTSVGGSWAQTTLPIALTSATYDAANQLTQWGSTVFNYDGNGNVAQSGVRSYAWDVRNQLASIGGDLPASYQYDAVGRRRAATVGGTTTSFIYDSLNYVQELTSGVPSANLLRGLSIDEIFSRSDAGGTRSLLADGLGSVVGLADNAGTVQTQYMYEPFGRTTAIGAASQNSSQYTGRENDDTGLYYYRARYYQPDIARFISEDPIAYAGGDKSLFAYALNAPTRYTDPTGHVVFPGGAGTFPSCDRLAKRKEPTSWDRLSCSFELGQILPAPAAAMFSPAEAQALRGLFGKGLEGVNKLLAKLAAGENVVLPKGITPQVLQTYQQAAKKAIEAGKDASGVQAGRLQAIEIIQKQFGPK